ncbi:hypothetical protein EDD22DRAFT_959994 [Suillus occidentalis]|nr:hypothetical protein EDD22DRAFT_959994 [Suillus occidentalis]
MGPPVPIGNNCTPGPSVIIEDIHNMGPWSGGPYDTEFVTEGAPIITEFLSDSFHISLDVVDQLWDAVKDIVWALPTEVEEREAVEAMFPLHGKDQGLGTFYITLYVDIHPRGLRRVHVDRPQSGQIPDFLWSTSAPSAPKSPGQTQSLPPTPTKTQDPFASLVARLRGALQSQHKVSIWAPERTKQFQMILVGKDVRFPPRKFIPPEDLGSIQVHVVEVGSCISKETTPTSKSLLGETTVLLLLFDIILTSSTQ